MLLNRFKYFLLEKRLGYMSMSIRLDIDFELIKTNHAEERQDFKRDV